MRRGNGLMRTRCQYSVALLMAITCGFGCAICFGSDSSESLALSCFDKPFLGVSASTPERDAFPAVQLSLRDPLGRAVRERIEHGQMPHAKYGEVIQIPKAPSRSKALAVEVCDAQPGTYVINIQESGSARYRLELTGSIQPKDTATLALYHISQDDRTLTYKFTFKIRKGLVIIKWLDKTGKPTDLVEPNDW
jgi:hypothetical protein